MVVELKISPELADSLFEKWESMKIEDPSNLTIPKKIADIGARVSRLELGEPYWNAVSISMMKRSDFVHYCRICGEEMKWDKDQHDYTCKKCRRKFP